MLAVGAEGGGARGEVGGQGVARAGRVRLRRVVNGGCRCQLASSREGDDVWVLSVLTRNCSLADELDQRCALGVRSSLAEDPCSEHSV